MAVDYTDKRFTDVKAEENQAIQNTESTYNEMINNTDSRYQEMIDASKDYAEEQKKIQQENTDFAIEKVEQAKDKAEKDYTKEQKGAYADYQKATGQYGANAEKLASQGLNQAGYSESVRTNLYNTYQNRYMSARESYNQAILNYDNAIKEAQLANNAQLAQIAYEALQQQLELSLQGFQYKNTLVLQKLEAVNQEKDRYYQRYQDVLQQINTENALAEQIRQFNAKLAEEKRQYNSSLAFQKEQAAQEQARWEQEYSLSQQELEQENSGGSGSSYTYKTQRQQAQEKEGGETLTETKQTSSQTTTDTKKSITVPNVNKVYQIALSLKNSSKLTAQQKQQNVASFLSEQHKYGYISDEELKTITAKLGY